MVFRPLLLTVPLFLACATASAESRTICVSPTGDDSTATGSESSPFATIQAAIGSSANCDTILVDDGVYAPFAVNDQQAILDSAFYSEMLDEYDDDFYRDLYTNAFALGSARSVSIVSRNGAGATFIDGGGVTNCAVLSTTTNVLLSGFTILNGFAMSHGGGVIGGLVEDSVIRDNIAEFGTAGGYAATFKRCVFSGNSGPQGGAVSMSTLEDCLIAGNDAQGWTALGAGAFECTLRNCTIAGNHSDNAAAATFACALENCIVWGNIIDKQTSDVVVDSVSINHCCLQEEHAGEGNFVADPLFVDAANGDFRLSPNSPCVDAGTGSSTIVGTDLDGNRRCIGAHVDIGCYEFVNGTQTTPVSVPFAWLVESGAAKGGADAAAFESSANAAAANGVNSVWECYVAGLSPTNASDRLLAYIGIANGAPVVTWKPDLGEARKYEVVGKADLSDDLWAPTNSTHRFFRVNVEMP